MTATTRHSIAEAISAVDGLTGHAERPTAPQAGDCWPLVNVISRGAPGIFQTEWRIAVVLAGDVGTATDQFDSLIPAVCDALIAEVYVDSARPLTINTEAGQMYGVEILARSE
jgi:hypothetical protein